MSNLPESFVKRHQENKIMADVYGYKRETQGIAKDSYERTQLPVGELADEIRGMRDDELVKINRAIIDGRMFIELLLRVLDDREVQMMKKSLEDTKETT